MKKRIIFLSFTIVSLVFCNLQCVIGNAFTAYVIPVGDIEIMECKDIKYVGAERVEAHYDRKELRLIGFAEHDKQFIIAKVKPKEDPLGGGGAVIGSGCDIPCVDMYGGNSRICRSHGVVNDLLRSDGQIGCLRGQGSIPSQGGGDNQFFNPNLPPFLRLINLYRY
jgi:hypothetical protein